jgi:cobalt transporter subunit CbtB
MSYDASTGQARLRTAGALAGVWRPAAVIVLGFVIVYVVGFAGAETIHNAAHDARHSLNFPCH